MGFLFAPAVAMAIFVKGAVVGAVAGTVIATLACRRCRANRRSQPADHGAEASDNITDVETSGT